MCQVYLTFGYLRFFALESQGLHRMGRAQEAEECQKEIVEILEVRARAVSASVPGLGSKFCVNCVN